MQLVHPTQVRLPDGGVITLPAGAELDLPALDGYREALIAAPSGPNGNHPVLAALAAAFNFTAETFGPLAKPLLDLMVALCFHRDRVLDETGVFPPFLQARLLPIVMPADHPLAILSQRLAEAAAVLPRDQWEAIHRATVATLRFQTVMYGQELAQPIKQLLGALLELDTGQTPELLRPKRRAYFDGKDGQHKLFSEYLFRAELAACLHILASARPPLQEAARLLCEWQGDPQITPETVIGWRKELAKANGKGCSAHLREGRELYQGNVRKMAEHIRENAFTADQIADLVKITVSQFRHVK